MLVNLNYRIGAHKRCSITNSCAGL